MANSGANFWMTDGLTKTYVSYLLYTELRVGVEFDNNPWFQFDVNKS